MSPSAQAKHRLTAWRFATSRSLVGPIIGALMVALVALLIGLFAAFMPPTYTARLAFVMMGALVVVLALLLSPGMATPGRLTRRLLLAWILVSVLWPSYLAFRGLPGPAISPTRLVYWSLLAVWLFWLLGSHELRHLLAARLALARPFVLLLATYMAWNVVSALFSAAPLLSLYHLVKTMGGPVLILLIAMSCVRDQRDIDFAILFIVSAGMIAVAIGLIEAVKKENLFFGIVPSLFPQGGQNELDWAEQLIRDKSRDGRYRVMSTFVHPLTFGEYLAMCLSPAVYLASYSVQRSRRVVGLLALPLVFMGIYITHTRSTLLALGVVMLGLLGTLGLRAIRQRRSMGRSIVGYIVLAAVPLVALALGAVALELSAGRTAAELGSSAARLTMLRLGSLAILDQPLIGYGPGFAAVTLGILPGFSALTIDNYYLSVALESGLPGLLVFVPLLAYPVLRGLAISSRMPGREGARLAVLAVALAGFTLVKSALSQPDNMAFAFLVVALLLVAIEQAQALPEVGARPGATLPKLKETMQKGASS